MHNCGLLFRPTDSGIQILYEQEKENLLRSFYEKEKEALDLVFKVYSNDEYYFNFSHPFGEVEPGHLLYFDNHQAADDGRLCRDSSVSAQDMYEMDSVEFKGVIDNRDKLLPPLFVLRISSEVEGGNPIQEWLNPGIYEYRIHFEAKEVYWKYYLFGRFADEKAYIHDPDGQVEFEPLGKVIFSGQKDSYAFRSRQRIPQNERYAYNFQLMQRSVGSDRDKLIMNRLPVAGIRHFGKETIGEQSVVVSEIYINS